MFNKAKFSALLKLAQGNRSLNEFARQASVSGSYISNLMNCKNENAPEAKTIKKIADAAHNDVTYADLLDAVGLLTSDLKEKLDRLAVLKGLDSDYKKAETDLNQANIELEKANYLVKEAEAEYKNLLDLEKMGAKTVGNFIRVPLLGNIAAGLPIFANENIIEWEYVADTFGAAEGEIFSLIVKGDSMTGSRIYNGDKVLVRIQQEVADGEIAVINVDGENATLKRVKHVEGKVLLIADNPKYDPILVESESARVCGKVIQVLFDPNRRY
ncbi:S24 family peptidase [Paenibacillus sinopodophylli]|uniref:S24 family peptidase n=1 Tax=Paenibacillus sinopodophylli TaxID=1837342 RepID=UPI00110D2244|nr:S24 family peptidase [Paenibacillus sinopodophylli]